jgi:hypothetical protein
MTCVANLCQAITKPPGTGSSGVSVAGSGSKEPGAAGMSGADASVESGSDAVVMNAGAGAASGSPAAAGKSGMSAGAGGAGGKAMMAAGAGGCSGSRCGECSTNADCEQRGIPGGTCVDMKCFAPEAQCNVDEDCVARGPEYMGGHCADKQCLPNPKWRCEPVPLPEPGATTDLTLPIIDALQLTLIPNVPVVACTKLDYMCSQPVTKATTNMDGEAKITVPANFAGYVQSTERSDYNNGLYFLPPQLPPDGRLRNFPLIRSGVTLNALAAALGSTLDPTRGHIMLVAEDCMGNALPGISFTTPQADAKTIQFYIRDQVPQTGLKDTPPEGDGGFLNLPVGTALVVAKDVKTGIELATVTTLLRAGFISMTYIRPISRGSTMTGVGVR